jgi:hypothetical protein
MQPKTRFGGGGIVREEKPAGEGIPGRRSFADAILPKGRQKASQSPSFLLASSRIFLHLHE